LKDTFTTGPVGFPGAEKIPVRSDGTKDFTALLERAVAMKGYPEDLPGKSLLTGFGHKAVAGLLSGIVEAVKSGAVKRFLLVGGCDGPGDGRAYYRELVRQAPPDSVILTLGCLKFRFHDLELGSIGGIPRYIDLGQCNDSYAAVRIALALSGAFETDVNSLPLNLILSWHEQKAVSILLSLLHLGVRNIRLGPNLPAFVSPGVLKALSEGYGLAPVTTPKEDLAAMFGA
jgi:hydroxylamine reductase